MSQHLSSPMIFQLCLRMFRFRHHLMNHCSKWRQLEEHAAWCAFIPSLTKLYQLWLQRRFVQLLMLGSRNTMFWLLNMFGCRSLKTRERYKDAATSTHTHRWINWKLIESNINYSFTDLGVLILSKWASTERKTFEGILFEARSSFVRWLRVKRGHQKRKNCYWECRLVSRRALLGDLAFWNYDNIKKL